MLNEYLRKSKNGIIALYYFLSANIFYKFYYKPEYIQGRWFKSKYKGLVAPGWKWMVVDRKMNKKYGHNLSVPWPVSAQNRVVGPENIHFHPDDLNNFNGFGCYFQGVGKISIGKGTYIAPNVGLITSNHDFKDLDNHSVARPILLGENCWIGMNSMILPGVELGPSTIVGAGSVVTKSFKGGNCLIGGNPAKIIKLLPESV